MTFYVIGKIENAQFNHRGDKYGRPKKYPQIFNSISHVKNHLKFYKLRPGEVVMQFSARAEGVVIS